MSTRIEIKVRLGAGNKCLRLLDLVKQIQSVVDVANSVAIDLGLEFVVGEWQAEKFQNRSMGFIMSNPKDIAEEQQQEFTRVFDAAVRYTPQKYETGRVISQRTVNYVISMAETFGEGEKAVFNLPNPTGQRPKLIQVTPQKLKNISALKKEEKGYHGAVIGCPYEWNAGGGSPFIKIRDIANNELVKCPYSQGDYERVLSLFSKRNAVVVVYGEIKFDPATGRREMKKATKFERAPVFEKSDYDRFFGLFPDLTGDLSAAEYIRSLRDDE